MNDQDLDDALLSIKNYIDAAIVNNRDTQIANKLTFIQLRIKNKVSVARIAILLGITGDDVISLENNETRLTVEHAFKLGQFYGVSADSLI